MTPKNPLWQMLEKLKAAFPEAVTETTRKDKSGKPVSDYAVTPEFIQLLQKEGMDFTGDNGRYELQFPGKQMARASALVPCNKTLLPDEKQSKNFRNTGNVFIEGDNLNALKLLRHNYRDRIKVVYIDPPYNTGDGDFLYNDDFSVSQTAYLRATGVVDDDGIQQISEVQSGLRGRFHAGWLAFMYPRLKLARELLADNGIIYISIDDNEQANLKLICDEIFGEENFLSLVSVLNNLKGNNSDDFFAGVHEYGLVYAKNLGADITFNSFPDHENWDNWNEDENGYWKRGGILSASPGKTPENTTANYPVYVSPDDKVSLTRQSTDDIEVYPMADGKKTRWYWSAKIFEERKDDVIVVRNGVRVSLYGKYRMGLGDVPQKKPKSILYKAGYGQGTTNLKQLLGSAKIFTNPKSVCLLKDILHIFTAAKNSDIVLDFFAGSATTAHAVMQLNAEDNGNRKFILVQLPEEINKETSKDAHEFCEALKRPATITEVAKERIRRAGEKIRQENLDWQGDNGFKVFTIEDSLLRGGADDDAPVVKAKQAETLNFKTNLKPANFDAVLYETLLHTGAMLDQPLTTGKAGKYPFAICNRNCYCVTEKLTQDIAREIVEKHGDEFDMLYYLSDALESATSYTQIESAVNLANKQAQMLAFY